MWIRARRRAAARGCATWITEAQAEPWAEAAGAPEAMLTLVRRLREMGCEVILLWGAEHWLWRKQEGDDSWWKAAMSLLAMVEPGGRLAG